MWKFPVHTSRYVNGNRIALLHSSGNSPLFLAQNKHKFNLSKSFLGVMEQLRCSNSAYSFGIMFSSIIDSGLS